MSRARSPLHGRVGRARYLLGQTELMLFAVLSGRYDRLIWGAVAVAAAFVLSRVLRRFVAVLEARHPDEERELARLRRGETALALVATAIPYVAAIVVLIVAATAFLPRTVAALGGSALILVLVGFGAPRFLMDVIPGALIAFGGGAGARPRPGRLRRAAFPDGRHRRRADRIRALVRHRRLRPARAGAGHGHR